MYWVCLNVCLHKISCLGIRVPGGGGVAIFTETVFHIQYIPVSYVLLLAVICNMQDDIGYLITLGLKFCCTLYRNKFLLIHPCLCFRDEKLILQQQMQLPGGGIGVKDRRLTRDTSPKNWNPEHFQPDFGRSLHCVFRPLLHWFVLIQMNARLLVGAIEVSLGLALFLL
jgi:hypothetical protein